MGLSLEVGILPELKAYDEEGYRYSLDQFRALNQCLAQAGLAQHVEPDQVEGGFACDLGSYSHLHHLRRLAAHLALGKPLPPPTDDDATKDPVVAAYYEPPRPGLLARLLGRAPAARRFEHLMLHSDAEGYYLPLDFPSVLFPDSELGIAGAMVGSAPRLRAECLELASALGFPLGLDHESDEMWDVLGQRAATGWQRYGVESYSCLRLIRACEASMETGAALVFC